MKANITVGLTEDQTKEIVMSFKEAKFLRKRLREMLQGDIDSVRRASCQKANYDSPSWAHLQADAIGYERAMRELISLLED